ncbi:MAG: hypothetical protein B6244_00055 [Candidatus Cloacimonetes bacterium 4572_55]|nr:MAG: hypothetical protein B6244_00055 [Candidatus Cloacimonetes bacterium 4572_55]
MNNLSTDFADFAEWKHLLIWIIAVVFLSPISPVQSSERDDRTLAVVNGEAITVHEFIQRYEGVIRRNKHIKMWKDHLKTEVLLSMIAEHLLEVDGLETGLNQDPKARNVLQSLEQALVRDRLYGTEVRDKVLVSDEEIQDACAKTASPRLVRLVRVPDKKSADALWKDIQSGGDIDTLAHFLNETQTRQTLFTWGESPAHVDSIIFNLETGETSPSFYWDNLFYFAKLKSISVPSASDLIDFQNKPGFIKNIKETIRRRKEEIRLIAFLTEIRRGQRATIRKEPLKKLADAVEEIAALIYPDSLLMTSGPLSFTFRDLESLSEQLSSCLEETMVQFENNKWTVGDMLSIFRIKGLNLIPARNTHQQLVAIIERHIDSWWLTEEGYHRRLDAHPEVLEDMRGWRRFYVASLNRLTLDASLEPDLEPDRNNIIISYKIADQALRLPNVFDSDKGDLIDDYLIRCARNYGVSANFKLLKQIPVTTINMFPVRYLGFGGSIPAIPQLAPLFKWHQRMLEEKNGAH